MRNHAIDQVTQGSESPVLLLASVTNVTPNHVPLFTTTSQDREQEFSVSEKSKAN